VNIKRDRKVIIYAPNIHIGGGFILLKSMLMHWPSKNNLIVFLDERASKEEIFKDLPLIYWVKPSLRDRLKNEFLLSKLGKRGDVVLCFHGLPPLFNNLGKIIVYQQNALLITFNLLFGYKTKTVLRVYCERFISYIFRFRVHEYIVQTKIMSINLKNWYGNQILNRSISLKISIFPFIDFDNYKIENFEKRWDFIYVADGLAHKNHQRLLEAWGLLLCEGIKPSLALTIPADSIGLIKKIYALNANGACIFNLGLQKHDELQELYCQSRALIYPSLVESFGLPLIEASKLKLDIIASELDYVYEVCRPILTFDPKSANSISRAIKKYLGLMGDPPKISNPKEFFERINQNYL
jgi:hypothetical protein